MRHSFRVFLTLAATVSCMADGGRSDAAPPPWVDRLPPEKGAQHADEGGNSWFGVAPSSGALQPGREAHLGVWIDVPDASHRPAHQIKKALSLVIDTSGSMSGRKIEAARDTAEEIVRGLSSRDVFGLYKFDTNPAIVFSPAALSGRNRRAAFDSIRELYPAGNTNMYGGLALGLGGLSQRVAARADVRRVILISDGLANIGPSTADDFYALGSRSIRDDVQITSIGVGHDYDESTLNALAIASSGRMYHADKSEDLADLVAHELALFDRTFATGAYIDVQPGPCVEFLDVDGGNADRSGRGFRVPLGTLHHTQKRELSIRVRVRDDWQGDHCDAANATFGYRNDDAAESVTRKHASFSRAADEMDVERSRNDRVTAILFTQEAARKQMSASRLLADGKADEAERELREAQHAFSDYKKRANGEESQRRLESANKSFGQGISIAGAVQAAPPSAKPSAARGAAKQVNDRAMEMKGY